MTDSTPSAHQIKLRASKGLSKEIIETNFDMYEEEFDKLLQKHKELKHAYDMGVIADKERMYTKLDTKTNDEHPSFDGPCEA